MRLRFRQLPGRFAVCRLPADAPLPDFKNASDFISVTRTADELSIACLVDVAPAEARIETPFVGFKLEGPFPFALTGVLASFVDPLAAAGISVFAVATFDTDYVLVKAERASAALQALREAGHELIQ